MQAKTCNGYRNGNYYFVDSEQTCLFVCFLWFVPCIVCNILMYFLTVALSAVEEVLGRIRSRQAECFGPRSRKKLAADSNQVFSLFAVD